MGEFFPGHLDSWSGCYILKRQHHQRQIDQGLEGNKRPTEMHPEREARQNFIVIGLFVGLAILTGLGIFGVVGLTLVWRVAAVISACVSLLLLILFWHPWLPVGVLINLGILVAILLANWPPVAMFGS